MARRTIVSRTIHRQVWPLAAVLLANTAVPAWAEDEGLRLRLDADLRHEDNLFRLPQDAQDAVGGGSDQVSVASLGLGWSRQLSRQRLELDGEVSRHRFRRHGYLDHDTRSLHGLWQWQWASRLTGSVGFHRHQSLASFADYRVADLRNLRTFEERTAEAEWQFLGPWHLVAGVREDRLRNGQTYVAEDDQRSRAGEAGLRYRAEAGGSLELLARSRSGDYRHDVDAAAYLDDGYRQREVELKARWPVTGLSSLEATAGHLRREHEHWAERDYGGAYGRLGLLWQPGAKLQLRASAARDLRSYQSRYSSYVVGDTLALAPLWELSGRLRLRGLLEGGRRDYRGAPEAVAEARRDHWHNLELALEWRPRQDLLLAASLRQERRGSTDASMDYRARVAGVQLQWDY